MKPVVFIHTPSKRSIEARVSAYSLRSRSRHSDSFEIRFLSLEETPELAEYSGCSLHWRKGGRSSRWEINMPQAFVLLRRRVPELMHFEGRALLLDPDIIARGDVWELLSRDMQGKALFCRPRPKPADGFYTSVMLMDCSRLQHWQWRQQIEEIFRHGRPATPWLRLTSEDPETIGRLEKEWNALDELDERTRLFHYTNRRTQPWLTGLPYRGHFISRNSIFHKVIGFLRLSGVHQRHPHEDIFLEALRGSLEHGEITERELAEQIQLGRLRPDLLSACGYKGKARP